MAEPSNWRLALDARADWLLAEISRIVERHLMQYGCLPTPAQIRAALGAD